MTSQNVEEVKCTGCGKVIDPDWCHCGEAIAPNIVHDNHHPIPAGCDCFRTGSVKEVKKAARDEGWIAGVAYAAQLLGRWGETTHAAEVIANSGLGYNDFDRCDAYDRKEVRRLFRTEPVLQDRYAKRKRK